MVNWVIGTGRGRMTLGVILALLSLLVMGASRVHDGLADASGRTVLEEDLWQITLADMESTLPEEHRESWQLAALKDAGYLLRVSTSELNPVKGIATVGLSADRD